MEHQKQWMELGFHYDSNDDDRAWIVQSPKNSINRFVEILDAFVRDPNNGKIGEHVHIGPYQYLKICTSLEPEINEQGIFGPIADIRGLANFIHQWALTANNLDCLKVHEVFGHRNSYSFNICINDQIWNT